MKVKEIMNTPAVTCGRNDTLNTAAGLMWHHDCGAIPVVDPDGGVVGMITDRDICMSAYTQGLSLPAITVSSAMSPQVFSCRADDGLDVAERVMSEKKVRRLPVVDGKGRPVGMLSLNDLARCAAATRRKNGLDHEVTQTLAAISEPWSSAPPPEKARRRARASPPHAAAAQP